MEMEGLRIMCRQVIVVIGIMFSTDMVGRRAGFTIIFNIQCDNKVALID